MSSLTSAQAAAHTQPGPRRSPAQLSSAPSADVSPQMRGMIAAPHPAHFDVAPRNAEWKDLVERRAAPTIAAIPTLKDKLGVAVEAKRIAGVNAFIVTPRNIAPTNQKLLLMHIYGGGYVFRPCEVALPEAMLLASVGDYKVLSVDYRMLPDFSVRRPWTTGSPHGGVRHLHRQRDDAGHGAARQGRKAALARRDRARHATVRHRQDERQLADG